MIKSLLCLGLLLACQGYGFPDGNLGKVLSEVMKEIPGKSAVWVETYQSYYRAGGEYPFFSPAFVRIGDTEEYRIVKSDLCLVDNEAYRASYFFVVLSPDDQLSLEVKPASGVRVGYQHNVPAQLPPGAIQERIAIAEAKLREYYQLEGRIMSGFGIGAFTAMGLLSGAGFAWIVTAGYSQMHPLEAGGFAALSGILSSLSLWAAIESLQIKGSNSRRMGEIRQSLRTLWQ
jgi:hypothetical protein